MNVPGIAGGSAPRAVMCVRRRYKQLYMKFRPEYYYWLLIVLLRKFIVIVLSTQVTSKPMFAAAVSAAVLFAAFTAQIVYRPYRSANADVTSDEALASVAKSGGPGTKAGSGTDAIRALDIDKFGADVMRGLRAETRSGAQIKIKLKYLFDYNKLESLFLCSGISVLLSGIMFGTSEFNSRWGLRIIAHVHASGRVFLIMDCSQCNVVAQW
jgi:hypothetical protein